MLKKTCAVSLKKTAAVSFQKIVAVLVTLFLLSLPGFAFQEGEAWITFDSPEGRFSVVLPTKPTIETKDIDSAVGKLTMYSYGSSNDVAYYMISFGDYPKDPVDTAQQEVVLNGVQGGVMKSLKAEMLSEAKISLNGHPGREFKAKRVVDGAETVFTWRIYLAGRRLYQLATATSPANAQSADVAKFLSSFQIKN